MKNVISIFNISIFRLFSWHFFNNLKIIRISRNNYQNNNNYQEVKNDSFGKFRVKDRVGVCL